ncbi:unnamed protein product [Pelagomonas calceolata]|uniref:Stress-response A/B barrel domain-containing protein n=1 Tax=Pelagomonas calceolata TaxID=35677 RepID=A0A8J2SHZ9_9STRA|nr:unnamed protein product [Pelagomonas calceolata]
MTLTHVVLLQWKPGTPESVVEPGLKKLGQIPVTETYILSYRIGKDDSEFGRRNMTHDVAIVAEFATEDDYRRYTKARNHLDAFGLLKPHLMRRHAVQTCAMMEWATPCSQRTPPSNTRVFAALVCGVALGRLLARR